MPSSTMIRRTRVEVDLAAIVGNARAVRAVTGTDVVAVVKADGYGHGAVAVARALTAARAVARRRGRTIDAHLKVDTGMGRLGVAEAEAPGLAADAGRAGIAIVGLMT